jgi:hypothetical protein
MTRIAPWSLVGLLFAPACTVVHTTKYTDSGTEPSREASLEVSWRVGASSCAEEGLASVQVVVDGDVREVLPCEAGLGTVEGLPLAEVQVELIALDASGAARFGASVGALELGDGLNRAPTSLLSALPGRIDVRWAFDNGLLCGSNAVVEVAVALFQDGYLLAEARGACEDAGVSLPDVRAGSYTLDAVGLAEGGQATWQGVIPVEVERGEAVPVDLVLAPF